MACHQHLVDDRLLGRDQESMKSYRPSNPRLLLSPYRLINVLGVCLVVLASTLVPSVAGKPLEDCEKVSQGSSSDVSLFCKLRTINSEFDKTNFSSLSGDSIVSLALECSNLLFYQSSLQAGSLAHLSRLQNLHIEHCKLSRLSPGVFSGLSSLKNLTIRTHNTAWPALSLDIASGVFSQPSQLEKIDISANNIWTFPERLFCHSKSLEHLNVSLNRLQDISDLGFREREDKNGNNNSLVVAPSANSRLPPGFMISGGGCRLGLQVLDISYNRLILLPARSLASLTQLKELYLQGNEISMVADQALTGLKGLRLLNLTDNKLSGLPSSLFHDSKDIAEVYLQNNSLVTLPSGLFSGLDQLVLLDLSHNSLTSQWLLATNEESFAYNKNKDDDEKRATATSGGDAAEQAMVTTNTISTPVSGVFDGLIRLVLLDLGHNELTHLNSLAFHDLYSLQILNLEYNQISAIEPNTFSAMNNLHTLILSHNKLTAIDATALNGLYVLSLLSLDNNDIAEIHHQAFQNCSSLKDLNLNGNDLERVPVALQNLTLLKTVDLGENTIEQLDSPRLIGLPSLYGLRVTGNRLTNVSKNALKELPSLRVLNCARNRIESVAKGAFDENKNLQAVRLDANFLQDIGTVFADLPSLIWLNVSDNHLSWFDYAVIPKQLQWLDLHQNNISDLGNYYAIKDLHLQTLDASHNRITRLSVASVPSSLETLYVNDNLIATVEPDTFYNNVNLSRVDIFANQIQTLEIRALQLSPFPLDKPLPEFYIAGNPIICDCKMEWLQRFDKHSRQYPIVMDLDSVYCKLAYQRDQSYFLPITELDQSHFLCNYETHCFHTCECCDFDACDCEMTCPDNCTCYRDATWLTNIVDCSARGHASEIPPRIPMDATEVYLDGNHFAELPSHGFIGKRNLRVLYLNNTGIEKIQNNSMSGLKLLSKLHLEDNSITELMGYEFEPLESIRELYLQNNEIRFIAENTFANLRMLEVLNFSGNKLVLFQMWTLSQNPYLTAIAMGNNQLSCNDCEFITQAATFIQNNRHKIMDPTEIRCHAHGQRYSLLHINSTQCSEITAMTGSEPPESKLPPYLPLLTAVIAICLLIFSVFLAVCRRKNTIRVGGKWPLNKCYQTTLDDDEKLYDAYVAYSMKDDAWVSQVFQSELQQYRLCLHHQNVTAYVSEAIGEAVESSKKTILILSSAFFEVELSRLEFKTALLSALRGKRNKLVIVTLGEITNREIQTLGDLRGLVISVNDKLFWEKLRCALPEPRGRITFSKPINPAFENGAVYSTSSISGTSTLPLNISSESSATSNHFHNYHLPTSHHNSMTLNHHHHHPSHHFYNSSTLGTNGFLPNVPPSHLNGNANGTLPSNHHHHNNIANNNITSNNSDSNNTNVGNGNVPPVPMYVPPFPPPNRPPPPFPAPRRPPPPAPAPLWA